MISIKVVKSNFEPAPRIRPKISKEEMLDKKLQYYYRLREELESPQPHPAKNPRESEPYRPAQKQSASRQ